MPVIPNPYAIAPTGTDPQDMFDSGINGICTGLNCDNYSCVKMRTNPYSGIANYEVGPISPNPELPDLTRPIEDQVD
eukprot:NODE_2794_length_401_cov_250.639205_g2712_i0.p1 GENE.NODE_2794_length_401_cov_250.639205_g2712_i0~~NODE_2794_length_401_cov_250.639205_g2712_i0.p1  ORF type:complete len:77 (+),score=13.36 NODE_2794_length_401_cov_250.639205_g2712_i0:82-312(+)